MTTRALLGWGVYLSLIWMGLIIGVMAIGAGQPARAQLSVTLFLPNTSGVMLIEAATGRRAFILRLDGLDVFDGPHWSPDRSLMAFVRIGAEQVVLQVMTAEGEPMGETVFDSFGAVGNLSWSPEVTQIATVRTADQRMREVLVIDPFVGTYREVPVEVPVEYGWAIQVAWSPDGEYLAFNTRQRVTIVPADGDDAQAVAISPRTAQLPAAPVWSPDGARLLYSAEEDNSQRCLMLTTIVTQVTETLRCGNIVSTYDWSPDGTQVVFVERIAGNITNLYVMDLETRGVRLLTDATATDLGPFWSPDGRFIAFQSDRDGVAYRAYYVDVERPEWPPPVYPVSNWNSELCCGGWR